MLSSITRRIKLYRYQKWLKALAHLALFIAAYYLSFGFRFNFDIPEKHFRFFAFTMPILVLLKLFVFWRMGQFRASWRYVGSMDLVNIFKASILGTALAMPIIYSLLLLQGFSRSILILDFIMTIALVGGARFSFRVGSEMLINLGKGEGKHLVIIGAGNAGESLVREIRKYAHLNYRVIAFFDDHPANIGSNIHGVPVHGPLDLLPVFVKDYEVELIFIAIPSSTRDQMRQIVDICQKTGCEVKTMPGLDRLMDGRVTFSQLRDVGIEDLLGREPVTLDTAAISMYLNGKTVLVSGAAGSIGAETCRQILKYSPRKLILLDQSETGLFEINSELRSKEPSIEVIPCIADICDRERVGFLMSKYNPDVIFHAAAYKHVPMMEDNPSEAVKNNMMGTKILADLAQAHKISRFVFISTDKAVNPTSVMGATKRVAELYLQSIAHKAGTKFMTVRFGNVLDSAGSVIPIFRKQIANGGPVTVTHPKMTRYFMTIPEATQLVMQAAAMGEGGEIFLLDMGEPVKILDLANDMIRLSGFTPGDEMEIVFSGVRPGEKLFEELWYQDDIGTTSHQKIFHKNIPVNLPDKFSDIFEALIKNSCNENTESICEKLGQLVPEYRRSLKKFDNVIPHPSIVDKNTV